MTRAAHGIALGLVSVAAVFAPLAAPAAENPTIRVIDGDGFELATGEKIRLWGIDAPELRQECSKGGVRYACGKIARDNLDLLLAGQSVQCEEKDRDRYGRTVALCTAGGEDVAGWMVSHGWALDWPKYSGGRYSVQQAEAKNAGLGLWAGFFAVPWEWREKDRSP